MYLLEYAYFNKTTFGRFPPFLVMGRLPFCEADLLLHSRAGNNKKEMTNTTAAAVLDEEVSATTRYFRPRPGFVPKSDAHEWRSSGGGGRVPQRRQKDYSSVVYDRSEDVLRLTYLHSPQVAHPTAASRDGRRSRICFFLTFEVDIESRMVTCVNCNGPNEDVSAKFQRNAIDPICGRLSSFTDIPSLFSVTSQLLRALNQLPEIIDHAGAIPMESTDSLVSRVATSQPTRPPSAVRRLLDLQTLLLRCAAAGRNRSKVCSPMPVDFAPSINQDGDLLARRVFWSTNQMYSADFRKQEDPMKRRTDEDDQHAWTMLTFLLSLPWTKGGRLTPDNSSSEAKSAKITLNISSALGDETPDFTRDAEAFGTVHAYHGTKIENVWSILNHGLRNLSYDNSLSENGAMMGAGVYLSTALEVADMFAQTATRNTKSLAYAFQHESLLRLLHFAKVDVTSLGPLDEYDISCLPVFEAKIIAPPPRQDKGAAEAAKTSAVDTKRFTRQEGKYFVADSDFIRITKLHLRFDLTKRPSVWSWLSFRPPPYAAVLIAAVLWIIITEEEEF